MELTRGISADLDVGGLQVFSKDTQPVLHTMIFCSLPVKDQYNVQSGQQQWTAHGVGNGFLTRRLNSLVPL